MSLLSAYHNTGLFWVFIGLLWVSMFSLDVIPWGISLYVYNPLLIAGMVLLSVYRACLSVDVFTRCDVMRYRYTIYIQISCHAYICILVYAYLKGPPFSVHVVQYAYKYHVVQCIYRNYRSLLQKSPTKETIFYIYTDVVLYNIYTDIMLYNMYTDIMYRSV